MTITSILCVIDRAVESRGVLRRAVSIARQERAWLTVLQVLDPSRMPSARGGHDGKFLEAADKDLLALIGEASSEAGIDPLAVRRRVRVGAPIPEILAEAEETDADLLVMGRDSFTRIEDAETDYESTAARVLAQSGRPVLLLASDDTTSGEKSIADTFAHAATKDALLSTPSSCPVS